MSNGAACRVESTHPTALERHELLARHQDAHLCFQCSHRDVCAVARACEAPMLVTVSSCLAFDAERDATAVVELQPIEAVAHA